MRVFYIFVNSGNGTLPNSENCSRGYLLSCPFGMCYSPRSRLAADTIHIHHIEAKVRTFFTLYPLSVRVTGRSPRYPEEGASHGVSPCTRRGYEHVRSNIDADFLMNIYVVCESHVSMPLCTDFWCFYAVGFNTPRRTSHRGIRSVTESTAYSARRLVAKGILFNLACCGCLTKN